ncbi:hypothetical protein CPB97_008939, partial [Podila verticillata]
MTFFKISKSFSKTSASKSIASAQSTPRSSMSVDQPSPVQNKAQSSSANAHYKTSSMAYAISRGPVQDLSNQVPLRKSYSRLQGDDDGVIAKTISSRFHKNCRDKPPRRSPDE